MEFRVLGSLEALDRGRPVDLGGSKRRAALAILLLHANEVVGKDRLIDELWGDSPPRNAPASLHNHVSRLRKALGPDVVVTKPWGYVLRADPDEIDLERFRGLVSAAEPLPASERAAKLAEALALWRGRPLADLAYEPGLVNEIASLEELRVAVLERRIDADLEVGRHAEVVGELESLIAENPLREHLRAQLILALYRSGRQAEALEVYRETRRVLVEELGLEPSAELRELEKAILRQDPALSVVAVAKGEPPAGGSPLPPRRRRRGLFLAVAAATLLALSAGAALAVFWPKDTASPTEAKAAPRAPTHPRETVSTTAREARHPARRKRVAATHRRKQVAPRKTAVETAPTATPPPAPKKAGHQAQSATHVGHPRRSPPPVKPKPALAPQAQVADSFGDGVIDSRLWYTLADGGADVQEANGRLELAIHGDAVPGGDYNQISGQVGTHCHFGADFDARVDFTLLRWPAFNGSYAQLAAFFDNSAVGVSRASQQWAGYSAWIPPHGANVPGDDTKGRLRLRRVGGVVSTYYWHGRRWVLLERGVQRGPANLGLQLFAPGSTFAHVDIAAAFDNFVVRGAAETGPACPTA